MTHPLTIDGNPKTIKGNAQGITTGILHLWPNKTICPHATACMGLCIKQTGRAGIIKKGEKTNVIIEARKRKTKAFMDDPTAFISSIIKGIGALERKAERQGTKPAVRLNGTSDIPWEILMDMQTFQGVQFYDYTKSAKRAIQWAKGRMPANYHLTFSRSEINEEECLEVLAAGGNVAVVFDTAKKDALPTTWHGRKVIDGDKTDLRFLDPRGVVVGLKAKGRNAKKDTSGFVVKT